MKSNKNEIEIIDFISGLPSFRKLLGCRWSVGIKKITQYSNITSIPPDFNVASTLRKIKQKIYEHESKIIDIKPNNPESV